MRALVVDGSPEPSSSELVQKLAAEADYVVAADRGAEVLHAAGVRPQVFCGDADSVSPEVAAWAHELAATDIRFPSEKYATDLALAVDCARHEAARRGARLQLTLTCATGGRPDHQLAVLGLLAEHADASPRVVEDGVEYWILSPQGASEWKIEQPEATFSAIALREGTVISERGSRWELLEQRMALLGDLGISNVTGADGATVTCHEGVVAVFLILQ